MMPRFCELGTAEGNGVIRARIGRPVVWLAKLWLVIQSSSRPSPVVPTESGVRTLLLEPGSVRQQPLHLHRQFFGLREYGGFELGMVSDPSVQRTHAPHWGVEKTEKLVGDARRDFRAVPE